MRASAIFLLATSCFFAVACRRTGNTVQSESSDAQTVADPNAAPSSIDWTGPKEPRELPEAGEMPTTVALPPETVTTTTTTEKPVDPFDRAIADVRAGAVDCFSGLPAGEYAATLVMTATPMGRVTRSEVEPGNVTDEAALKCLKAFAESRTFPTSKDGRTVRVEVRVKG